MDIHIAMAGTTLSAKLDDNPASRDFWSLLPLTLTLKDYAETEKIGDLPKPLTATGTPPGHTPAVGDICYYRPWGNLALFHKNFTYSDGLIQLGKIEGNVDALRIPGPMKAVITRVLP